MMRTEGLSLLNRVKNRSFINNDMSRIFPDMFFYVDA